MNSPTPLIVATSFAGALFLFSTEVFASGATMVHHQTTTVTAGQKTVNTPRSVKATGGGFTTSSALVRNRPKVTVTLKAEHPGTATPTRTGTASQPANAGATQTYKTVLVKRKDGSTVQLRDQVPFYAAKLGLKLRANNAPRNESVEVVGQTTFLTEVINGERVVTSAIVRHPKTGDAIDVSLDVLQAALDIADTDPPKDSFNGNWLDNHEVTKGADGSVKTRIFTMNNGAKTKIVTDAQGKVKHEAAAASKIVGNV